jgi:hypothetical protein
MNRELEAELAPSNHKFARSSHFRDKQADIGADNFWTNTRLRWNSPADFNWIQAANID